MRRSLPLQDSTIEDRLLSSLEERGCLSGGEEAIDLISPGQKPSNYCIASCELTHRSTIGTREVNVSGPWPLKLLPSSEGALVLGYSWCAEDLMAPLSVAAPIICSPS